MHSPPQHNGFVKPYDPPISDAERADGVICKVTMARSATAYIADIEAYLVEQEMPAHLAETVAKVIDVSGWSLAHTVQQLRVAMTS